MRILLFANTGWYLYNFRLSLARTLSDSGHDVFLVSPTDEFGQKLLDLGFQWIASPMSRRSLNPLREVRLIFWLWALLRSQRIDLIHSFTIKNAIYGSIAGLLAGVSARIGAITGLGYVFISNDNLARALRPVMKSLFWLAFSGSGAHLILQNPDDEKVFLSARLVRPEKVSIIPGSGVDCKRFTPATKRSFDEKIYVLLAARLLWDKGVGEFVHASRLLKGKGINAEFILAGSPDPGNPASIPNAVLAKWEAQGLVSLLGQVADMPALLRSVDIAVLPSYREGLPKGLLEAGACGLPLITTNVPGCREVVTHEVDGLLVPVRDSIALAAAIERLTVDRQLRARLGNAARDKIRRAFEVSLINTQTMEIYDSVWNSVT